MISPRHAGRRSLRSIFFGPLLVSTISIAGLVCGLVGDGVWDMVSWLLLAVPVAFYVYFFVKQRAS